MDEYFGVLSHRYRRYVVRHLQRSTKPVALADLTDALVRWETEQSPTTVPETRERIYAELYHTHLPKLAQICLLTFDPDANLVSRGRDADAVDSLLECAPERTQRGPGRSDD